MQRKIFFAGTTLIMLALFLASREGHGVDEEHVGTNTNTPLSAHVQRAHRSSRKPAPRPSLPRRAPRANTETADRDESGAPDEQGAPPLDEETARCATGISPTCPFRDPSAAELIEMARCATVKTDYPPGLISSEGAGGPISHRTIELAAVTEDEEERITRATDNYRATVRDELDALLLALGGSRDELATMTTDQLVAAIRRRQAPEEATSARKEIARARARWPRADLLRQYTNRAL
jgi:hypothetical protein